MRESHLLLKAEQLQGMTFAQLAYSIQTKIPDTLKKGWLGQAIEIFLGAQAGNKSMPDFPEMNIELKTVPLLTTGKVAESTYVTTLPLTFKKTPVWEESACYHKLQKVLWIPIEGDKSIPYSSRRIGRPILWSPNEEQSVILKNDWELITEIVLSGRVSELNGSLGDFLHIRPKAADSRVLTSAIDIDGEPILTLPRGFYLRTQLTNDIIHS